MIYTENEKLYSPVKFYLRDNDMLEKYDNNNYWQDDMPHYEASEYMDAIELFLPVFCM